MRHHQPPPYHFLIFIALLRRLRGSLLLSAFYDVFFFCEFDDCEPKQGSSNFGSVRFGFSSQRSAVQFY